MASPTWVVRRLVRMTKPFSTRNPKRDGSQTTEQQSARRKTIVMAQLACTLGVMVGACGEVSTPAQLNDDPEHASGLEGEQPELRDTASEDASRGGSAAVAPTSLEDCIAEHVTKHGSARKVAVLSCPAPAGATCEMADLTPLSQLTELTSLNLASRCVEDVGPLAKLTKLQHLELRDNQVNDIRPLGALHDLRSLGLANNPVHSLWGYKNQEPFASLSRLEELNLDGTEIKNILPLESLSALRVLSLRANHLTTLHSIRGLTRLEELYADDNSFVDLQALERLTQLKILTVSRSYVASVEPLVGLVKDGQLTKVELDGNCVTSCKPLADIELSCAEQAESCDDLSRYIPAGALSVPYDSIDEEAKKLDLPLWEPAQVEEAFALIRDEIDWSNPSSDCDARARDSVDLLASKYPALTKAWAFGSLRPLTPVTQFVKLGYVSFDWHVAPVARTERGLVVLDPAFVSRPVALNEWYARLVDSKGADLNFSCFDYHASQNQVESICGGGGAVKVDERGDFVVDEVRDLRGTICKNNACEP